MCSIRVSFLVICVLSISPASSQAAIGINVSPNSWDVGSGGAGVWISPMVFSVTNVGDQSVKLQIRATDTQSWRLANTPALNKFAIQWGQTPVWNSLTTLNNTLVSPFNAGQSFPFNLRYQSPTSIEPVALTTKQNSTVTISAISPAIGVWEVYTVAGNVGGETSLALDKNNYPRIAYQDSNDKALKYAEWDGITWTIQVVDVLGVAPSINLDNNGNPHISYYGASASAGWSCKYAKWTGTQWQITIVEDKIYTGSGLMAGMKTSMELDSNEQPHIAYYSPEAGNLQPGLKYASLAGGMTWNIQTVEIGGLAGQWPSLTLNSNNSPHIAYHAGGGLKYAFWNGVSWAFSNIDKGAYSAIALDGNDFPNVAYYDYINYDLKYAKYDGSSWVINAIDSSGDVGAYCSLKIDSDNRPHIAYQDGTNGDLKYATSEVGNWRVSIVDSLGQTGIYNNISLDANNYPHISYLNNVNVLKYSRWR